MTAENPIVAENAVTPNALAMDRLALIGLMSAGDTSSALIRTPQGEITKVVVGDAVGAQTVAAISDDSLILAAPNGRQTMMYMPS